MLDNKRDLNSQLNSIRNINRIYEHYVNFVSCSKIAFNLQRLLITNMAAANNRRERVIGN